MKSLIKLILLICLVLTAAAAFADSAKAPAFNLKDQNGKDVSLSDFNGKVVVLEWVNPDCPFVKRHYKEGTMQGLHSKYANQDVAWIGINSTYFMGQNDNLEFFTEQKLQYPILSDPSGEVGKAYAAKTTPFMVVINKTGEIAYQGAIDDDPRGENEGQRVNYVDKALTQLIAKQPVETASTQSYGCSVKYKS